VALCCRDAPQEEQAFDVIDEVGQSDFRRRPCDPDRAEEQVHCSAKTCSMRGRIFDLALFPPTNRLGHDAPFWFLAMDVADKAVFCHELRVGGRPVAVSAHTTLAVLVLSRSPSRRR